ncbi:MAG TPA: lipoyl synthase, partial [Ilumatobacteraceae bacterium]|nr:lipoyl synthase [Ilumatobacteraceae bacterium]
MTLRVRWLGKVPYREALAVQQALFDHGSEDHLLLLEHPHVFTHGPRADLASNVMVDPASVDAELVSVKRGGDVTYHGPGQLVGYPIVNVPNSMGAADHVCAI